MDRLFIAAFASGVTFMTAIDSLIHGEYGVAALFITLSVINILCFLSAKEEIDGK